MSKISTSKLSKNTQIRPFLKWAGGKYRLLEKIKPILPCGKRLIEPFSGSAAVFLNTDYKRYWLNDLNVDLIMLYKNLKNNHDEYTRYAQEFFSPKFNNEKRYYQLRDHFNTTMDVFEKSVLFLYLNRHSYNGLCRYNKKGGFNAPFGRYIKPHFPKEQLLYFALKAKKAKFTHQSFEKIMQQAKLGDVVYCDPPYVPLSHTASFTQYTHKTFSTEKQHLLSETAIDLAKRGIPVIISNHDTPFTRKLYQQAKLKKFTVPRFISCKANKRLPAKELLAIFEER